VAAVIDPDRVIAGLEELRALSSDEHGAQRVAWSPQWRSAREWLLQRISDLPLEVEVDEAGNLWATLHGEAPEALVLGSHLDSIPAGGWLDGSLGVVTAAEVVRAIAQRGTPRATVKLVDWADEEGVRFGGQSMYGSATAAGALDPRTLADLRDAGGIRFADAVSAFGVELESASRARERLRDVRAYLELHIEQGPVLESLGLPLAVVTAAVGIERHMVCFAGAASHAGSTPMSARRDALCAASRIALEARALAIEVDGRATAGVLEVEPGLATVVPAAARLTLDLRHEQGSTLTGLLDGVREAGERIAAEERTPAEWRPVTRIPPVAFDPELVELAAQVVASVSGAPAHRMPTGALHDAAQMAWAGVPSVMLFVQSRGGVSHSPEEDTDPEHLRLAVRALAELAERALRRVQT
jgi:hydantoinase/carbamoylase family amidase